MSPRITLCLIGEQAVGKSSIIIRYCEQRFDSSYQTSNSSPYLKKVEPDYSLHLMESNPHATVKKRDIYLVVFDVTDSESLLVAEQLVKQIGTRSCILIGAKSDLIDHKKRLFELISNRSTFNNVPFIICSSKTNTNINELFSNAVQLYYYEYAYDHVKQEISKFLGTTHNKFTLNRCNSAQFLLQQVEELNNSSMSCNQKLSIMISLISNHIAFLKKDQKSFNFFSLDTSLTKPYTNIIKHIPPNLKQDIADEVALSTYSFKNPI